MVNFLINNWLDIAVAVVFIAIIVVLYKHSKIEVIKKIILALVVQAEKSLGSGTGELKYALVIERVYNKLPFIIRVLFSKKDIDNYIEEAVIKMKGILNNNVNLIGYDEEKYMESIEDSK